MDTGYDDLLANLAKRPGMYAVGPLRLLQVDAYLAGFSWGRADGVFRRFQEWFSQRHPVDGGYANPVAHPVVLADRMFAKRPEELTTVEDQAAIVRLCELFREFLDNG